MSIAFYGGLCCFGSIAYLTLPRKWDKSHYEARLRQHSHPQKVFNYFSTNGVMTINDFIRSLKGNDDLVQQIKNKAVKDFVKFVDENQDGIISFQEYLCFKSLLSASFEEMDLNNDGVLTFDEFKLYMDKQKNLKIGARTKVSYQSLENLFGKGLSQLAFLGFIDALKKYV